MLRTITRRIRIHHLLPMLGPSWCLAMLMGVKKNSTAVCYSLNTLCLFQVLLYLCPYARSFLSSVSFPQSQSFAPETHETARTKTLHDEGHFQRRRAGARVSHICQNHSSPEWQPPTSHIRGQRILDINGRAFLHSWCRIPAGWCCRCARSYA